MSVRASPATQAMRARRAGVLAGFAVLLAAALVRPASAESATGHVSVTILPVATVTESTPMDFGAIGPGMGFRRIIPSPAGAASGRAGYAGADAPVAGAFRLTGAPHTAVTLSFSPGEGLARPGAAMSLGGFAHDASASPSLNGAGTLSVAVGATLTVASPQPPGRYHGTYMVVVNY